MFPPLADEAEASRKYFVQLRELRDSLEKEFDLTLPHLLMGMTNDFPVAVEEGAYAGARGYGDLSVNDPGDPKTNATRANKHTADRRRQLAIAWNDGLESFFKFEMLRRACPCAACGGEPDVLDNISRRGITYTDKSFRLIGFDLVGGYALQPRWADGHSTGIYSFTYFADWERLWLKGQ